MEKRFHLRENGTTPSTELRAGLTTFVAMAYIIFLNPVFLSSAGMSSSAALAATCLSAALGTLISGLLSNRPFAMASGMGMNAYFAYTLCGAYGYSWQQALALTFISGCVFLGAALLAGKRAVSLIPENLRHAITAGIGLFLLLIGLLDAGIVDMTAGYPSLGALDSLPVLTSLLGLMIIFVLTLLNVQGSLILGMLITAAFSLITKQTSLPRQLIALPTQLGGVIFQADFAGLLSGGFSSASILTLITVIVSMSIVDMFDSLGFLIGTGSRTKELTGQEETSAHRVLIADAVSTIVGSLCGASTVTVYAESAAGVEAGGRTGLTALTTAACFLLAMFFSPAAAIFTSSVTAPALIMVGIYLLSDLRKLRFDCMDELIPAIITIAMMPFAYSITAGIGAGFIAYVICKLAARKVRQLRPAYLILAFIFLLYFVLQ